jgi:hypothetical protein
MGRSKVLTAFCALSLVAAACGRGSSPSSQQSSSAPSTAATAASTTTATSAPAASTTSASEGVTTTAAAVTTTAKADPCAGKTLEATETGVSKDTITVVVMADVGSELAPGLFQGSMDGTKAWAKNVNANGGLACRKVEVITWDTKISPAEGTNGFLEACSKAAALIGSTTLFIGDVNIINTCPDKAGAATGIADVAERAVDAAHQCSPNVFTVSGVAGVCPYGGKGSREWHLNVGPFKQLQKVAGVPLHGIYLIPADLPSTIISSMPNVRAINALGYVSDGEFGVSGRAEQAVYAEYVAALKAKKGNLATNGSNDQSMIKLRSEAAAQGLDAKSVTWSCSLACYTKAFRDNPVTDGTYVWLPFLPFEERTANKEIDTFLTSIGQDFPQSWAVNAWNSGRAFEVAINKIVAADGPNGITRAKIIKAMGTVNAFDGNKWLGAIDVGKKGFSPCFVLLQVQGGKYVRQFPKEVGTLDCDPGNIANWTGDSEAEFKR